MNHESVGQCKINLGRKGTVTMAEKLEFKKGDFVVYPAHGVGRVEGIDTFDVAGQDVMLYSISFEQDRMRLKVPVTKAKTSGLRRLSSRDRIREAITTLQGKSKIRRVMWSRRAQEYESKINSGDPVSIAEVVRDLHRGSDQPEQSYSERQIYQAALERLARELAAVEKIDQEKATQKLENVLTKEREKKAA
jgi:CarD family transcriptional regulator